MGFDLEFSGEIGEVAGQPSPPPAQEPITAPTGEYDVYIRKLVDRDERKSAADRSMAQAITKNPDEYARYVRLSKLTGMDPDMLLEEPDMRQEAERRVKKNSLDFDSLIKTNPKTVEFLSDPQNATIAQDDVPFFQRIENSFKAIGSGYRTAEGQEEMFGLARKWMDDGKLSPVEMARLEKLQGDEAHKARLTGMEGTPEYVGRSFGYSARQFMGSMKATMFGAGAGGIAGFGLGFTAPVVGNVAGGTAGIVAGGLTGGAVYSYDMERAGAFLELSRVRDLNDQPINQSVVKTVANAVGVVNAVIEMSSDFMVARMIPGVKDFIGKLGPDAAKAEMRRRAAAALSNPTTRQAVLQAAGKLGGGASIEGIEEFIQSLVGAGGREVAQATSGQGFKDDAISDDLKQASSEALQAFTGILFLMAPVGGMHYANMRHQQRVQRDNKEFFDALAGAADSKAHQRLPEKTREFVEHLKQGGGAKDIFIDADRVNKYFQSKGVDASLVMEQVLGPEGANQFNQALALKADVVIPVEAYAEKLAGTEHHQGLAEDLRLRQGDMSEREFKLAEANLSEDEKTLRTMAQDAYAQIVADEPAQRIYQEMYGEALAGGGATPTQASTWAAIQAAHMRSRFSKLGPESQKKFGDAYGLWKAEYGITIRRPMPEVLSKYRDTEPQVDALLNAMRERKIPQESPDHQFTDDERALVASVNELGTVLEAAGLDVDTLTNEQIRAQLFRQQEVDTGGGTVYNTDIDDQTYAQSLDVYQYSNGLFGFTGDNFMLSAPQDIGAWIGDTRSISYDITAGRERLGTVVLAMRGPEVIGLSAIEIDESGRGQGLGRAVVEELLDTYGRLEIYGIRDSARGFWNKLGVKYDETQSEFERNGILETDAGAGAQRAGTRQAAAGGTFNQEGRAGRIARPGGNERTVAGTAPRQNWVTNTAIRGRDGLPLALLRGENRPLSPEDFKPEAFGYNTGHASSSRGVHFTNSTGVAEKHGTIRRYWLDVRKPFVVESDDDQYSHIETPEQYFTWRESLRQRGYDGIIISTKNIGSTRVDIVVFDPEQVIPVPEQQTFYQSQKADRLKLTGIARHWVIRNEKLIDWGQILSKPNGAQILTDIVKARVATELGQDGVKKYLSLDLSGYLEILAAQGGGFHNEELARAIQAYQSDKVKAVKAIEKWVADSRKEVLNEWHGYLTGGNDAYANNPFFQDYVWNGITSELRNNRPDIPASLNPAALAIVYDSLMERPDGRKFMPLYSNALEQVSIDDIKDNAVDLGAEKEWIKISQAPKGSEDHKKNSELLRNLSCSTWCTSRGMEKEYVASGDFWVLRHGGGTKLAIRFNGDGEVVEIQGQRNDGTIPLEYAPDVKALVNSGSVKLGARSMAALKRALAESSRITKIAAMSHNKLIKYFNLTDLGDGTYAFTPPGRNSRSVKTIETLMKSAMWPLVSSIGGDLILHEGTSAPNVTSIGGDLILYEGASAPNVTSVGGDLSLYEGASAPNVTSVGGGLYLHEGTSAPNVTSVGGDLRLDEGASAPNVTSVGGDLILREGTSAPNVTSVGGDLYLYEGASAPNVTSVGGNLYLDGKIIPTKNWPKYGINAAQGPKTFYQSAPLWYSALHRSVEATKTQKAPASQWLDIIRGLKGVKKDEITWSGVGEWLQLRGKESTTRAEVLQFLDQNGVKVEETFNLGEDKGDHPDWVYEQAYEYAAQRMDELYPDEEDWSETHGSEYDDIVAEVVRAIVEEEDLTTTGEFSQYQLPGGEDYKELLLTLPVPGDYPGRRDVPAGAGVFRSSHWDSVPNVLAHVRFNTRIDADGKLVLFLEEIQSDWAQEGREEGFKQGYTGEEKAAIYAEYRKLQETARVELRDRVHHVNSRWSNLTDFDEGWGNLEDGGIDSWLRDEGLFNLANDLMNAKVAVDRTEGKGEPFIPTAPFVTDTKAWVALVLKRMIRYAAENGFNRVAWTTGDQQNARWNLAQFDVENRDGIIGGEGMRAFYDGIVPQVANDLLRRLGGDKVKEIPVIGEMVGRERTPLDEVGIQPGFDITPGLRANALSGLPLFQKKLGSVTFGNDYRLIQLLEDANLSTFLHELSHTWLEEFQADAARPDAGEQIKKDWDTTRRWLGLAPGEAISVEAHEQWARGGEAYFMEGNAPSIALREIFQKFKAWMQLVYKNLSELDVKLNDDIRAVFDRLIATDEEIENARRFQMYAPVFSSPEQAGMTSAEWSAYTKATANSRADAQDQVTRRVMRELQRENEKWWKDELAKVEGAVRAEAMGMPVYKALWLLSKGEFADGTKPDRPIKLSKQGLINSYGEPYLKELAPKKLRTGWIYAVEGGVHHDVVAGMVGFDSGDEMIKAITSAAPINEWVEAEAKQRMLELHGDMLNDGSIAAEAIIAVHNDRQAEVLETELRILRRKRAEVEPIVKALRAEDRAEQRRGRGLMDFNIPAAILRDMARREIGGMRVGVVDPMHYAYAEARAGREALDLMAEGDFDGAAEAKQRQIMNHFFYREALRARKDVDRGVGHMTRLSKTKARARIGRAGQEWLEQLDAILERYSLSPMTRQSKARGLLEWAKAVEQATGESVALSPEVMDEAHMINYRELTVDQFRALHDSVSSIEHVARKITQVIRNGRAFEKGEMVNALVNAAEKSLTSERPLPETDKVFGQARTAWELTRGFFAANLRPEKIIERLDGGTEGVWHDLFWNPAIDAQTRRDELRIMVMKPLIKMQEAMGRERQARMSDGVHLKTIGKTLTRRTLIGVALNVGNASNRDKLMRGGMWFGSEWSPISDVQLSEMLDQLDAEDWKMVQGIWDAVGLLYPHLDDLNRRAVGLPLDRVQLTPITTKHGVFNGGYWPAVADPRHSKVGEKQENAEALATELFAPRYPKAATMHSFREARTEAAYPIQLDWERVLANHVSKAITDIAYHEWIKQSRRLLENQKIKKVIQNRLGEHVYRSMEEWLVHQVRPIHGGYMANAPIDNITNSLVSNTVIAALGFKAATAIGNIVVAPMQASHQVKSSYMVRALAKYLSNPAAATEAVFAMSGEMRHRYEHLDQTFNTVLKTLEGRNTIRAQIGYWAMQIHRLADRWTSTFIWMAKYQQEVDGGKTPEQAQRLADKTIRTTQMAGAPKDLSSFERDPRYRMFKMFIGPMIVMQNEMRGAVAGKGIKAAITPQVWATMFATWIMPAVMFEMAVGRGPDDDDEWWEWALLKILVYPAMTVPFVRDAANAIEQMISGKHATTRSNPISDVVMLLAGTVRQALKEDAEIEDFVKAAAKATGVMVGLPTSQVMITGEFMYDNITGNREMEEPADLRFLIYKRRKGE